MISATSLVSAGAAYRYDDHGDPAYTPTERILLVLRRWDWCDRDDLWDSLDVPPGERNRYYCALSRLVRSGRVEQRGSMWRIAVRL